MHTLIIVGWHYKTQSIPAWIDVSRFCRWAFTQKLRVVIISDQIERFSNVSKKATLCYAETKKELLGFLYHYRAEKLLFYYTGHGLDDSMLLPSEERILWNDIFRLFNHESLEVTYVIDCCYPPDFSLSYTYCNGWREQPNSITRSPGTKILTFTPSIDRVIVGLEGSIFTETLVRHLAEGKGYDAMYESNILIRSNVPHVPIFHTKWEYRYLREHLMLYGNTRSAT